MFRLIIICLVFVISRSAFAADSVNWRYWNAGDGMVESYVSSLSATPGGSVVIRHGAVPSMDVLDGYHLKPVPDPRTMGRVYGDGTGTLFGLDPTGLRILRDNKWTDVPVPAFRLLPFFNQFKNYRSFLYSSDEGMEIPHRIGIIPSGAGRVLVMFPDRIEEWNGSHAEVVHTSRDSNLGEFLAMEGTQPGLIWISGTRGVGRLSQNKGSWRWEDWAGPSDSSRFIYPSALSDGSVIATATPKNGQLKVFENHDGRWEVKYSGKKNLIRAWQGNGNEIWIKDGEKLLILRDGKAIPAERQTQISGLISDVQPQAGGIFWLATSQALARYSPALWETPTGQPPLDETVNSIAEDAYGGIWFTSGHTLVKYAHGKWQTVELPDRQDTVATESIAPLSDGRVVLGTDKTDHIWIFDSRTMSRSEIRHPEGRRFGWIQSRDKDSVWVQSRREGDAFSRVEIFDGFTFRPVPGLENIPIVDLRGVLQTPDGALWAGGVEGLVVFRDGKLTKIEIQKGLPENDAFGMFQTREGKILIGHRNSLTEFDGKQFHTVRTGLNRARSMIQTSDGTVWIASGTGVHRWRPDAWITNSLEEGLPSPAAYKVMQDRTGRVWVATTLGISLFHPEVDQEAPVTGIPSDRNVREIAPHGEARFNFAGRDRWKMTPDERLMFSWAVDGNNWSAFTEEPFAAPNSIKPGKHVFRVRAMDRNGNVDPRGATYDFTILSPWYKERGFYIIAAIAAISLLTALKLAYDYHSDLRFQSRHDPLTGLSNRIAFDEALETALARGRAHRIFLILLDLDGFKRVNDHYGHQAGDALLKRVGIWISECLDEADELARLGGDEFAILLNSAPAREHAAAVAKRILEAVRGITDIEGQPVQMSASIGISVFPDHAASATSLLRVADVAMYQSKARNKDCYVFFDPSTQRVNFETSDIAGKLRAALNHDGFHLVFQPIVEADGRVTQVEALARIHDRETGLILPDVFIRVAEETNLICELGLWVITSACKHLRVWRDAGLTLTVAVNVSPLQLEGEDFVENALGILTAHGLHPWDIGIEVTEQAMIRDKDRARSVLGRLRTAGVPVSLDDFGAGYSSLEALNTLPVDSVKIDRSLVHAINASEGMRDVGREIITVAHSLGAIVVAEGIEDATQLKCLQDLKCDRFQGYFISTPLDAGDVARVAGQRLFSETASPVS